MRCLSFLLTAMVAAPIYSAVEVYPGPAGDDTHKSVRYTVEVSDGKAWRNSHTYGHEQKALLHGWHEGKMASVNFTTFGTSDAVSVRITNLGGPITDLQISPKSKRIVPVIDGNQATFPAKTNHKLWIIVNGDDANPLFIFADAPKPPVPKGATYFGPGVRTIEKFKAVSHQVIYLDGGAWVRGNIDVHGTTGVKIMGPGILSGDLWDADAIQGLQFDETMTYAMITGDWQGNDASVEGITILDSPTFNFWSGATRAYGVKLLSPWHWSTDGFQAVAEIDQVFAFVGDNVFTTMYAGAQGRDMSITNSFAGTANNAVFVGGFWGNDPGNAYSSLADNIDIRTYADDPLMPEIVQIWVDNDNSALGFHNQTYANIRIEGNLKQRMLDVKNMVYPWPGQRSYDPPLGNSSNIVFKNISLEGTQPARSQILGLDAHNGFRNVTFENLTMAGTPVTSENFREYFDVNDYVWGLRFTKSPDGSRRR